MNNVPNDKMTLPQKIRFNVFARYFTMFMALLAIFYAGYVMFYRITADSSALFKAIPIIIVFLALDSFLRNGMNLNTIYLTEEFIEFGFLMKPKKRIAWGDIKKVEITRSKRRMIRYIYTDNTGKDKIFTVTLSFPHMLAILNTIADKAVNAEFDEFLRSVLITK